MTTPTPWRRWAGGLASVAVLVLGLAGCSTEEADPPTAGETTTTVVPSTTTDPVAPSEQASPFTVEVPEGWTTAAIGRSTNAGSWGEDCCGTDEPYTVLSPDGTSAHPDIVVVSSTGYAGYQGGLAQASAGYPDAAEPIEDDGIDGFSTAAGSGGGWADVVVARDDEIAIRATGPTATVEELVAVVAATATPSRPRLAPEVPEPPPGLHVVGRADTDAVLARTPGGFTVLRHEGGTTPQYTAAYLADEDDASASLAVHTFPGTAVDPSVAFVPTSPADPIAGVEVTARTVAGRPAVVAEWRRHGSFAHVGVAIDSAWGDTVLVVAAGPDAPTVEELVDVAASVTPTDRDTWDELAFDVAVANGSVTVG